MLSYRITKYDPTLRNVSGAYLPDEWTSYCDVELGRVSLADYERVEHSYVLAAQAILREAGVQELSIAGLEDSDARARVKNDDKLSVENLNRVLIDVLRNQYWCRLEGENAFVHLGYDYYMYVGVPKACKKSEAATIDLGLFVERFPSPLCSRWPLQLLQMNIRIVSLCA